MAHQRIVELAGIVAVAAYATRLLGEPDSLQPFLGDLTAALRGYRAPETPTVSVPLEAVLEPPLVVPELPRPAIVAPAQPASSESYWDPDLAETVAEASRARALLLELIRRAAHDWVLYRTSRRMDQRELAQDAYTWLFEEGPGHIWWESRRGEGRQLTAFLGICDLLELDPDFVRERVKQMTPHGIKMAGRPAENRHRRGTEIDYYVEHGVELVSIDDLEDYE